MIGLVMAGGKGTRMNTSDEKLLLKYIHPTILHVIFALQNSECFSKIIAGRDGRTGTTIRRRCRAALSHRYRQEAKRFDRKLQFRFSQRRPDD